MLIILLIFVYMALGTPVFRRSGFVAYNHLMNATSERYFRCGDNTAFKCRVCASWGDNHSSNHKYQPGWCWWCGLTSMFVGSWATVIWPFVVGGYYIRKLIVTQGWHINIFVEPKLIESPAQEAIRLKRELKALAKETDQKLVEAGLDPTSV